MQKKRRVRLGAIILALCLTFTGCAGSAHQAGQASENSIVTGRIVLTDPQQSDVQSPTYRPENPPADHEGALRGVTPSQELSQPQSANEVAAASQALSQPQSEDEVSAASQAQLSSGESEARLESTVVPNVVEAERIASGVDDIEDDNDRQESSAQAMMSRTEPRVSLAGEMRGVWISYLEMASMLTGKSRDQFAAVIGTAFDNIKSFGLNTVFVQVRPFGDALYASDYFPWSYLITGTEGKNPGFDPLAIMVEAAHARGLRVEAWLNPYRVRAENNKNTMSTDNYAKKWLDSGHSGAIKYNGAISYNPANQEARELIVNGAREIVRKYDVDGIHIDDYFYPTTDTAFDSVSYNAYRNAGGALALADWRRQNVETLIKAMYTAIKAENPDVLFGISPQSSVDNNYNAQYLDVAKVSSVGGYCDYICPQIYFGFENGTQPFLQTLESWNKMVDSSVVKLYVGLAAYKCGVVDNWAGAGKNEWLGNADLMRRMVEVSRAKSGYGGFILYRYDHMFNPAASVSSHMQKELNGLKSIL